MFITLWLQVPKLPESKIQVYKLVEEDLFKKAKSFTFLHKSALRFKGNTPEGILQDISTK